MGRPFLLFSQQHDAGRTQENEALNCLSSNAKQMELTT
jgi:hypothetical protein